MCGFCGVFQEENQVEENLVTQMREYLFHRGPDEGKNYLDGNLGMGFRRLKISDPHSGEQPMSNEDETLWIMCNGEIYNYRSLRSDLIKKGHRFRNQGHTEVILHLYEETGTRCLHELRGMFAFVIWDQQNKLIFGARDRFGIKPFYYFPGKHTFAFASEIKSFLALNTFHKSLNFEAFLDYLVFQYVPEPRTIFSRVFKLPPAHYFIKEKGNPVRINQYWKPEFRPDTDIKPLSYYTERIRNKLEETIQLHLESDVPRGAFLSSGIDSTIIAAMVRQQEKLRTYSVGYGEKKYSELTAASETANYLGTEHSEYMITPEDFLEHLPRLAWHLDEPVADPAAISLYFVARMAAQDITISLSGEGADEVFGGYGIYREPLSLAPYRRIPGPLRRVLKRYSEYLPDGVPGKNFIKRGELPLERKFLGNARIFEPHELPGLLKTGIMPDPFRITDPFYARIKDLEEITRMQYIDLHTWLPGDILLKADKMTMANSLELRAPFLDHELFELAATIPTRYKVKKKTTKLALREAFKDLLPSSTVKRTKRGFPVPTREWIRRKDFRNFFFTLMETEGGRYFEKNAVNSLFQEHMRGSADRSRKIWTILIFLLWHHTFMEKS